MFKKCDPGRVKGFLRVQGRKIVNEDGEEVVLTGWGVGNWLLQEGYMWLAGNEERFDRPRRIEQVVYELTGSEYAERFWKTFRDRYVTREDIRSMRELGYNSVRIPINWRVLMKDEPGNQWCEDGFAILDRCLDWCEEFGIYAILDLHGAPGSQSGWNTDDSIANLPRLLMDEEYWNKGIALWEEIARRYKDRWIVGGYDLLNEPVRPGLCDSLSRNKYISLLVRFYDECIAAIRKIDKVHLVTLEGNQFSADTCIFFKEYDPNMVIHFHRYACMPGWESFKPYLEVSEDLDHPLWLGETGENKVEWLTALFGMSISLDIGVNLWPWKKMAAGISPCTIPTPEGWDEILTYIRGGNRPSYERAQQLFDEYLDNILFENCVRHTEITDAVFRVPEFTIRGTDFDQFPGKGQSFSGGRKEGNEYRYRSDTKMCIEEICDKKEKEFFFDCGWDQFALVLEAEEFADYTICSDKADFSVSLQLDCTDDASVDLIWNGKQESIYLKKTQTILHTKKYTFPKGEGRLRISVKSGKIRLHAIHAGK